MSDDQTSDEFKRRTFTRLQQEYDELDDPVVRGQLQLDRFWQSQLDQRAASRRRVERPGAVDAESGIYDPVLRFENEF